MIKVCSKCGRELPCDKYHFFVKRCNKDGFNSRCKECCGKMFTQPNTDKEGYKTCKECKRELPYTPNYFPKIRGEKNLRCICRECNPKYGNFIDGEYKDREYWSEDDNKLFVERYPNYTNEELRNLFYPELSDKQLSEKAYKLNVSFKSNEVKDRRMIQQSKKLSVINTGKVVSDETKKKLSEKRKQQYKDGTWIPSWTGRIPSIEERENLSKRVKGLWAGENNPRFKNPMKGDKNPNWKGGITFISVALRENISEWKDNSMKLCEYKCILTGGEFDAVHHVKSFNSIVMECIDELGLTWNSDSSLYSDEERCKLIELCKDKHVKYGLGLCLHKDLHRLFHVIYSYNCFTVDNFKDFMRDYFNGKYDDKLEDKLKSINSKRSYEEAKKIASFHYAEN